MQMLESALRKILLFSLVSVTAAGCGGGKSTVKALVPQGLILPFTEIERVFEMEHPDIDVEMLFASSGTLSRQVKAGMPADVICSASDSFMDDLCSSGLADTGTRTAIASNRLVLVRPSGFGKPIGGPKGLLSSEVRRFAIGNPGHVPAGMYAMQTLRNLGIADELEPKIVLCEHVRQALSLISRGEVDAGFVYRTDALSDANGVEIEWEAPPGLHEPIVFSVALATGSRNREAAGRFAAFVTGPHGLAMMRRFGFAEPENR